MRLLLLLSAILAALTGAVHGPRAAAETVQASAPLAGETRVAGRPDVIAQAAPLAPWSAGVAVTPLASVGTAIRLGQPPLYAGRRRE